MLFCALQKILLLSQPNFDPIFMATLYNEGTTHKYLLLAMFNKLMSVQAQDRAASIFKAASTSTDASLLLCEFFFSANLFALFLSDYFQLSLLYL